MESLAPTEPVLLVLLSLAEQPRHGYSILKDVERMSSGRVMLSTGTLCSALRRLLDQGCSGSKKTRACATDEPTDLPRWDGDICNWKSSEWGI